MAGSSERTEKGHFLAGDANPARKLAARAKRNSNNVVFFARQFSKESVRKLVAIMRDPTMGGNTQLRAAELILNRAWGSYDKPIDPLAGLDSSQLAEMAKRVRAMYSGTPQKITIHSDKTVVNSTGGSNVGDNTTQLLSPGADDRVGGEESQTGEEDTPSEPRGDS